MLDVQATWQRLVSSPSSLDSRHGCPQITSQQCLTQLVCSMEASGTPCFRPLLGSRKEVGQPVSNWALSPKCWKQDCVRADR